MREDDQVWCEIRLDEVGAVLDRSDEWKESSWADAVDWERVCAALADVLQQYAREGAAPDLRGRLDPVLRSLDDQDRLGLVSLVSEPITVTRVQLTNGRHRLNAMRRQGVRTVPGLFARGAVGVGVAADQLYPLDS